MACVLKYKAEDPHQFNTTGNESSSFVSEKSKRSSIEIILEHKKSNLLQIELMFSFPKIGRFWFFSLILDRSFKCLFLGWSPPLFIEVGIAESKTGGCSGSILLSITVPGQPFTF